MLILTHCVHKQVLFPEGFHASFLSYQLLKRYNEILSLELSCKPAATEPGGPSHMSTFGCVSVINLATQALYWLTALALLCFFLVQSLSFRTFFGLALSTSGVTPRLCLNASLVSLSPLFLVHRFLLCILFCHFLCPASTFTPTFPFCYSVHFHL